MRPPVGQKLQNQQDDSIGSLVGSQVLRNHAA